MKDTYKNVHSHIFNMDNAPEYFLNLYMPKPLAKGVNLATNSKVGVWTLQHLIKLLGSQGERYVNFLRLGKSKNQLLIFRELAEQYTDKSMEIVALTMNMEYIGAGKSKTGFEGQLEGVIEVKKQFPDKLNIFMGIDPRWKSSGTELRKEVERNFETRIQSGNRSIYPYTGLKLYPSTGFYAFDEKLKETFQWAADNGVPVMTHCYYLGGIFNYNKGTIMDSLNPLDPYTNSLYSQPSFISDKKFWKWIVGSNETANCKKSCSYFLEPHSYESMLKFFDTKNEQLKICFAHFGGVKQIIASLKGEGEDDQRQPYGVKNQNWFDQIRELLAAYPGVYADISYDVAEGVADKDNFLYKTFMEETNKPYGNKILFGTDFFMTEMETEEKNTYNRFKTFSSSQTLANGATFWDQIAKHNPNDFLRSKYYP